MKFHFRQKVKIVGGFYKNNTGTVVEVKTKTFISGYLSIRHIVTFSYKVIIDDESLEVWIKENELEEYKQKRKD